MGGTLGAVGVGDVPHVGVVDAGDAPQGVVGVGDRFALFAQVGSHFTDQASRIVVGKLGDAGFGGLQAGLEAPQVVGDAAGVDRGAGFLDVGDAVLPQPAEDVVGEGCAHQGGEVSGLLGDLNDAAPGVAGGFGDAALGVGEGGEAGVSHDGVGVGADRAVGECDARGPVGGVVEGACGVHHGRWGRVGAAGGEDGLTLGDGAAPVVVFQGTRDVPSGSGDAVGGGDEAALGGVDRAAQAVDADEGVDGLAVGGIGAHLVEGSGQEVS